MNKQLIKPSDSVPAEFMISNSNFENKATKEPYLDISELFYDSIQGEGVTVGYPAAFLRLQGCTLDCAYCDTKHIRDMGQPYFFEELFTIMEKGQPSMIDMLGKRQHLVITGGSPLLQQDALTQFIRVFIDRYEFKPFIEIENECVITPYYKLVHLVDVWNNSPKLSNSENILETRYKSDVIRYMASLENSWFKFVICEESDWMEIERDFLDPGLIKRNQILLMPQGVSRKEVIKNSEVVISLATKENIRYGLREHVILWDRKTGI